MFSPCSQGVSSTKNPTEKHAKEQNTLLSIPDQDGRFTSLGPRALKSCPLFLLHWQFSHLLLNLFFHDTLVASNASCDIIFQLLAEVKHFLGWLQEKKWSGNRELVSAS